VGGADAKPGDIPEIDQNIADKLILAAIRKLLDEIERGLL
jgi:hypothetical protein